MIMLKENKFFKELLELYKEARWYYLYNTSGRDMREIEKDFNIEIAEIENKFQEPCPHLRHQCLLSEQFGELGVDEIISNNVDCINGFINCPRHIQKVELDRE